MKLRLLASLIAFFPTPAQADPFVCLAEAIYFEAGSRGEAGRAAVAHVILNRVASHDFPATICAVIAQGEDSGNCQFSYRCDGLPETIVYADQMRRARATARAVLDGTTPDPTGGALFFHSERIPSGWFATRPRAGTFGGNVFYR